MTEATERDSLSELLDAPALPSDFGFTEDHDLARQEARRFLNEHSSLERVRTLAEDDAGFDRATWSKLAELGWIGLVSPEEHGGAGLDLLHLALLFEEMGRTLLPSPFFGQLLALHAVEIGANAKQRETWCPRLIDGSTIATFALTEPEPSWDPTDVRTTATSSGDGFALRGTKTHVLFGGDADALVLPALHEQKLELFWVDLDSEGVTREPEVPVDPTRRTVRVTLDGANAQRLQGDAAAALPAVHRRATAMLAAEMVGGIEATLGITRDYAADREQFGRKIGSFQAVKHPIVDVMVDVELARSQALAAALALQAGDAKADTTTRMAKALASDAFAFAARKGVQLHGGYGFTWDCDVHFFFKRALWSRATLGDGPHHRRHLAATLFDRE